MRGEQEHGAGGRIADPEDFEAAFQQYFVLVFRFLGRRVGPAIAEDLAAETFATAYRRRASFDPERGSLRSWLFGIATNLVRSHWRAEQHLLALDARLVPEADLADGSDAVDRRLAAAWLAPQLAAALALLTQDQRDVLLLYAWGELSHEEIAAALGIAPGTARSRLSRARGLLREQLGDFDADLWTFRPGTDPAREGWVMTDEIDVLRRFRDEMPGPSAGAWARARSAIEAARSAEGQPGQQHHRDPRRRPSVWIAAAVAGILVVAGGTWAGLAAGRGAPAPRTGSGLAAGLTAVDGCPGLEATSGTAVQIRGSSVVLKTPEGQLSRSSRGRRLR